MKYPLYGSSSRHVTRKISFGQNHEDGVMSSVPKQFDPPPPTPYSILKLRWKWSGGIRVLQMLKKMLRMLIAAFLSRSHRV